MGKFTMQEAKFLVKQLKDTWSNISDDMFLDEHGEYDDTIVLQKSEVVEVSIDRMEIEGASIFQRIVIAKFWETPFNHVEKQAIIHKAFPYASYGT